jgi:HPt (histidine-containing phosphotransfer) domain-containing protein
MTGVPPPIADGEDGWAPGALVRLEAELGVEAATQVAHGYLAALPGRLAALADAEPEQARRVAHTLRSGAALVGLEATARLAAQVEAGVRPPADLVEQARGSARRLRAWLADRV